LDVKRTHGLEVNMIEKTRPAFRANSNLDKTLQAIDQSMPLQTIESILEQISLSADAKSLILEMAQYSIVIGEHIVAIGRKIISFAIEVTKTVPNTLLGVAIALILASLMATPLATIPVLGTAIAGFLKTIFLIFGIAQGALADMRSGEIGNRIENLVTQFAPLESLTQ
jgi:hypothetical protein